MKFFFKQNNKANGFTLIETLVAISIFTFSILGLMSVLTQSISNTYYAKQKMIAAYLAQEGIEYIRNMRDTFVLYSEPNNSQAGWNAFKNKLAFNSCEELNGCYFDDGGVSFTDSTLPMADLILNACNNSTCSNGALLFEISTGKYGFSGESSGFVRKIQATPIIVDGDVDEIKISSTVSWIQGSGTYPITFSENLFNWIE